MPFYARSFVHILPRELEFVLNIECFKTCLQARVFTNLAQFSIYYHTLVYIFFTRFNTLHNLNDILINCTQAFVYLCVQIFVVLDLLIKQIRTTSSVKQILKRRNCEYFFALLFLKKRASWINIEQNHEWNVYFFTKTMFRRLPYIL